MVGTPSGHEFRQLAELLPADGGLDVERLQVITEVTIDVLVVVTTRELTQLPTKSFAAGIVLAGRAPTIATPISKRFGNPLELPAAGRHRSAFSHGQLMRRVEALRCEIAERRGGVSVGGGAARGPAGLT